MARLDLKGCLSVLTEVADRNTIDGKPIVLNKQQCHHLAHTCISSLKQIDLRSLPHLLVKQIHGTLQEILAFFNSCTKDLWLRALATHLDTHEAHLLHLKDFMICIAVTLSLATQHPPYVDSFIQRISDFENDVAHPELKAFIDADRREMIGLLREQNANGQRISDGFLREKNANGQHRDKVWDGHQVSKKTFSFTKMKLIFQPSKYRPRRAGFLAKKCDEIVDLPAISASRLAGFLAKKCDEIVDLSAIPESVPKAFCINPQYLQVFKSRVLGDEGISRVYDGTWLDQRVAVKEFDTQDVRFIKETVMLAGLSNPYIIKLIGWSENKDSGTYSLVMERMPEGLHDYLSCNSPSLEVKVDIMLQISRGMKYLHAMNVIHRDLKPSNVLVRPCEHKAGHLRIKISDFGEAKHKPEMPFFSTDRLGTWYYRAPEVLQYGEEVNVVFKKYTLKADVFSFAILCYEILAEKAPECYVNCAPKEFYNRVRNNVRPDLPDYCPLLLSDCIQRCWHLEPSQRPSFVELS